VLVFYVDKRERMIVFVGVVAALARVVAEVDLRAWQTGLTSVGLPLSKAIEKEVESMKMPPLVVYLTAIGCFALSPASRGAPPGSGAFHSSGGGFHGGGFHGRFRDHDLRHHGDSRDNDERHHRHFFNDFDLVAFGFPYWWYPGYGYVDGGYPDDGYSDEDAYNDSAPAYGDQYWQDLAMKVQWALSRRGYYDGPIDGVIGADATRAIRAFQEAQGLPATGRIDPSVLTALKLPLPQVSSRPN
jgi:Putative peptidoglycan binding domain